MFQPSKSQKHGKQKYHGMQSAGLSNVAGTNTGHSGTCLYLKLFVVFLKSKLTRHPELHLATRTSAVTQEPDAQEVALLLIRNLLGGIGREGAW